MSQYLICLDLMDLLFTKVDSLLLWADLLFLYPLELSSDSLWSAAARSMLSSSMTEFERSSSCMSISSAISSSLMSELESSIISKSSCYLGELSFSSSETDAPLLRFLNLALSDLLYLDPPR